MPRPLVTLLYEGPCISLNIVHTQKLLICLNYEWGTFLFWPGLALNLASTSQVLG